VDAPNADRHAGLDILPYRYRRNYLFRESIMKRFAISLLFSALIASSATQAGPIARVGASADLISGIPISQCTVQHSVVHLNLAGRPAGLDILVGTAICSVTPAQKAALTAEGISEQRPAPVAPNVSPLYVGTYRYTDIIPTWMNNYSYIYDHAYFSGSGNGTTAQWYWTYYYPGIGTYGSFWTTQNNPGCYSNSCAAISWIQTSPLLYYTQVAFYFNGPAITLHTASPS
jgi:hypothetical protein